MPNRLSLPAALLGLSLFIHVGAATAPAQDTPPAEPRAAQADPADPLDTAPPPPAEGDEPFGRADRPRPWRNGENGRPMPDEGPLSREEIVARLRVVRALQPDLAEQIEKLHERHPQRVASMLRERWPRLGQFMELRRQDPESFELRLEDLRLARESHDLARQFRQAKAGPDTAAAEQARAALADKLREHFAVRQELRRHELERLEMRLAELKQRFEERSTQQEAMINARIDRLLDQKAGDW